MSNVLETVLVKGGKDGPVRVNKSDFDADQAEGGAKKYTLHTTKGDNEKNAEPVSTAQTEQTTLVDGVPPAPVPSAPNAGNDPVTQPPQPGQKLVTKKGSKFVVVGTDGNPIEHESLNSKGYGSEADAWAAIMAMPHGS